MDCVVKSSSRMSVTTSPRRPRTGSRKPVFFCAVLVAGLTMSRDVGSGVESPPPLPLERFRSFPPLPGGLRDALAETAPRSAEAMAVEYVSWPSLAPFSIGPRRTLSAPRYCNTISSSNAPFSQLFPLHSTVKVIINRVLLLEPHIKQYLVLVRNTPPLGTSGVCVLARTEIPFSRSNCSSVIEMIHFVCLGPMEPGSGLM